jgi:acetoin utilization deacetylase AcuC-like enzyme
MPSPVPVVHSPDYACDIGIHVFPVEKYERVRRQLVLEGVIDPAAILAPQLPARADLLRVHTAEYLDDLGELRWTPRTSASELPLNAGIVRAYSLACSGTTIAAVAALGAGMAVHLGGGFHHAFADRAEGFCYLNDLAVAIRALQHHGRVRRAAVVDLDVHQGNGTAGIFHGDPSVFTLSVHQEANYPNPKPPSDLDVGLADGTGDTEYLARLDAALERVWSFAPEIVLYQAGADPYAGDVLGGLSLTLAGLAARDARVLEGCHERGIPAVVTLGGGYARDVADTVEIHAQTARIAARLARRPAERTR